jgi:hypothetical protein
MVTKCNAQAALLVLIFGDKIASEKFHTSIDGGLNLSNMHGLDGSKKKFGLYFGLGTFLKLNDKWALTPEFKPLSQRGAKDVKPLIEYTSGTDLKYSFLLNYIDIPVLVQYKITSKLFVSGGPQISFLTSAKQQTTGKKLDNGSEFVFSEDIEGSYTPINLSIPVEIGYSLPEVIPGQGIEIKVRYCFGLYNVFKDGNYGSSTLSGFQFFLSFPFIKEQGKTME